MPSEWLPDPRVCRNCDGLGILGDFSTGEIVECEDCGGIGTEYAEDTD